MTFHTAPGDDRHDWRWRLPVAVLAVLAVLSIAVTLGLVGQETGAAPVDGNRGFVRSRMQREATATVNAEVTLATPRAGIEGSESPGLVWTDAPKIRLRYSRTLSSTAQAVEPETDQKDPQESAPVLRMRTIEVRRGDSLYTLFKAEGLSPKDLAAIMAAGKPTAALARLRPKDRISVYTDAENQLQGLTHERPGRKTLSVARRGGVFRAAELAPPVDTVLMAAN